MATRKTGEGNHIEAAPRHRYEGPSVGLDDQPFSTEKGGGRASLLTTVVRKKGKKNGN